MLPDWPPGTVAILATVGAPDAAIGADAAGAAGGVGGSAGGAGGSAGGAGGSADQAVHAIPVSAAVRAGPRHILIGLGAGRGSLARLRTGPRVALAIIAEDLAVTARGRARVLDATLVEGVVAVEIEVDEVDDHDRPTFAIEAGVAWRWTDADAERRDHEVREALMRLAARRAR
ncbi:MAG: hypothetical protein JO027_01085 [Solirubrobacterales bacterium]|nr:hypothetical protein [Solirubrobacterales bacterium]